MSNSRLQPLIPGLYDRALDSQVITAVKAGKASKLEDLLFFQNASPNAIDEYGVSALHHALSNSIQGNKKTINPDPYWCEDATVTEPSYLFGDECFFLLYRYGASIHSRNPCKQNKTVIHRVFSENARDDFVQDLLSLTDSVVTKTAIKQIQKNYTPRRSGTGVSTTEDLTGRLNYL